jgi:UDP-N-acetylmuramate dehydrogenase
VQAFYEAHCADEVVEATWKAEGMGLPWQVIGHGSNILASDEGYPGAVIVFHDERPPVVGVDGTVTASGGLTLSSLINFMAESGCSGLEELAGIPGTVGGAIAGNAGAYGKAIGESVESVLLLDRNGTMRRVGRDDLKFAYRWSSIKENGFVVLEARIRSELAEPAGIRRTIAERLADRANKHPDPNKVNTAGSFFKNPTNEEGKRIAAGHLLEEAGCGDLSFGGAKLWHSHANIIVADADTKATDVKRLSDEMAERVSKRFGIELTPEVSFLGQH